MDPPIYSSSSSSSSSSSDNIENECLFCFENISKYNIAVIDCGHSYHYHCIQEWVTKTKNPTRLCPQCNHTGEIVNIVEGKPIRTKEEMNVGKGDSHQDVGSYLIQYTNPPATHPQIITDYRCCNIL
jgi:hypothetical protein